jgi:hypothetical protein
MQNMVENRMRSSIYSVAAIWFTAWVNAGQPDLSKIDGTIAPDKEAEDAENAKNIDKIKGREEAK